MLGLGRSVGSSSASPGSHDFGGAAGFSDRSAHDGFAGFVGLAGLAGFSVANAGAVGAVVGSGADA